ncbi:hypothetical protein L2X99_00270 [Microbacterium sp. KUDC0406]|uniref:DUF6766 family protein n=1 Tax=Microbacterium sp. KUDC0406 TaxID=2909588 RepID=UPI001F47156B|nr:DUF6766 family protein [Microbacterium sp. KUDC0406]UJP11612.1 hypothetical protein L2X99_00270 [Microbacterium sp. KUDC0406]
MRRTLRDNALGLFFLLLFLLAIGGQSVAGYFRQLEELAEHGRPAVDFLAFVLSPDFVVDVAENWQSEFLQFFLFIGATVWLVQRGSPESKKPGDEGRESDEAQKVGAHAPDDAPAWAKAGGWRLAIYGNSLLIVMGTVFVLSWLIQSLAGTIVAGEESAMHGMAAPTWGEYVVSADFWDRTLQNWQSEFLAVGTMVAFSIYLRQRGSAESKPVGMPHAVTAAESE